MANLTREEMAAEIAQGRSILFSPTSSFPGGKQSTTEASLPSQADLAVASGDPVKKEAARQVLLEQQKRLEADLAALDAPTPPPDAPEPVKTPEPVKPLAPVHVPPVTGPAPMVQAAPVASGPAPAPKAK